MKANAILLWFVVILEAVVARAEETEPSKILKNVVAAYGALDTYCSEGTVIADVDAGGVAIKIETSFSMKLKKPNQYMVSWTQKSGMTPFNQSGAVWNDGSRPYLFMSMMKGYSKMPNDEAALSAATGISSGAAFNIPSLFLPGLGLKQPAALSTLVNPKLENSELIEGDDCYVISGSTPISKKETYWISKKSKFIRKHFRSLEPPEGELKLPEMTDQQLEQSIKQMGQEVTDENKQALRKMYDQAANTMKTMKPKGSFTELQKNITTPKLTAEDFAYKVPAGTTLKESLFSEILKSK